jgi:tetratricopeptide (TPR) repeat protein
MLKFNCEVVCSNVSCCNSKITAIDTKRCSRCQSAYYCSRQCQVAHWKLHKICCISVSSTSKSLSSRHAALALARSFAMRGNHLGMNGEFDEALLQLNDALAIYERVLGHHDTTAMVYNNIGGFLHAKGRYDDALTQFEKALEVYKMSQHSNRQENIAMTYNNIGNIHYLKGQYNDALVQYQKALRIYRECEHRSNTALSCTNIGVLLHAKGKYDDALVFFRHALAVNKLALDDDNPESANSYEHIGNALCAKGMYDDALVAHRKALEKRKQLLGANHPRYCEKLLQHWKCVVFQRSLQRFLDRIWESLGNISTGLRRVSSKHGPFIL